MDVKFGSHILWGTLWWILWTATTLVSTKKTVSMLGTLPFEQVYLQMMKWILGVNKKTANAEIYGDTGRYPLSIVCSKQLIDYFQRVTATKDNSDILAIVKDGLLNRRP